MLTASNTRIRNPLAVVAWAVLVGLLTFVAVLVGLALLGRVVTHSLDGLGIWIVVTFSGATISAFASFVFTWRYKG